MKQMVAEKGVADQFEIASAATEGYNEMVHEALDYRAADMLRQMKVPLYRALLTPNSQVRLC